MRPNSVTVVRCGWKSSIAKHPKIAIISTSVRYDRI
jgi:hypothetical protein